MRQSEQRKAAIKAALDILKHPKASKLMRSELAKKLLDFEIREKELGDSKQQRQHELEILKLKIAARIAIPAGESGVTIPKLLSPVPVVVGDAAQEAEKFLA